MQGKICTRTSVYVQTVLGSSIIMITFYATLLKICLIYSRHSYSKSLFHAFNYAILDLIG